MASLKEQYVDKGQEIIEKGQAIERAIAAKERYERRIQDATTEYNGCIDELEAIVAKLGEDPLGLLGKTQGASRPSDGAAVAGRGKNQTAILGALSGTTTGLTQAAIIESVKSSLGGGSDASITQATAKLYKDGAIRRTGIRGSFLYWPA